MANNRIYLRCKGCGKKFFLGKRFCGGYYTQEYPAYNGVLMTERINKFYDEHEYCNGHGLDCFELVYECGVEDWGETNADAIRHMNNDELAKFLAYFDGCNLTKGLGFNEDSDANGCTCTAPGGGDIDGECATCVLAWLNQKQTEEA